MRQNLGNTSRFTPNQSHKNYWQRLQVSLRRNHQAKQVFSASRFFKALSQSTVLYQFLSVVLLNFSAWQNKTAMHLDKKISQRIALKIWLFMSMLFIFLFKTIHIYLPTKAFGEFVIWFNYELPSNYITTLFKIIRVTLTLQDLTKIVLEK